MQSLLPSAFLNALPGAPVLWCDDLPATLANLQPHAPGQSGAFGVACSVAASELEQDVVSWEESVRWMALGWDEQEEYVMDMLPRFRLDAWPQKRGTVWTDALWQRLQVADEVYRRKSEAPSDVVDLLIGFCSDLGTEKTLALWRADPVRFWFVWVQPLGLRGGA